MRVRNVWDGFKASAGMILTWRMRICLLTYLRINFLYSYVEYPTFVERVKKP